MNLRLVHLDLVARLAQERIEFEDFSYFYGEIGAGKSTIARLIDYCLAGKLTMTPALQSEFVSATLVLDVGTVRLSLTRERGSDQIVASWPTIAGDEYVVVPARRPGGIVVPGTQVEVLSDLLFHLNGEKPPRVRRSSLRDDSELERLSIRDLLWYCYLDQDSIDSNFFHLDAEAETFRRLKSRNVLRYLLGIHQERVAELEVELEDVRRERVEKESAAKALQSSLNEAGISSEAEIANRLTTLEAAARRLTDQIATVRAEKRSLVGHAMDRLRREGSRLAGELEAVEDTEREIEEAIRLDRRHRNEIMALSTKVQRIGGARAVLNGVEFVRCPRCAQALPERSEGDCTVCGQPEPELRSSEVESERTKADIAARSSELDDVIDRQTVQLAALRRRKADLLDEKSDVDRRLDEASRDYDSSYLSSALEMEREHAAAIEEHRFLSRLRFLPSKVDQLKERARELLVVESTIRDELRELRAASEKDLTNVDALKELFLDCLLRSNLPGFSESDVVRLSPPSFLPDVINPVSGDLAVTSFATQGSGGKKTLFKCCFALAVHRLAASIDAPLPPLLIIDSPMKNISERENRAQFEGFHRLLYELATDELAGTQFILIDKEFCPPPPDLAVNVNARHMRVDSTDEPPLIPYYRDRGSMRLPVQDEVDVTSKGRWTEIESPDLPGELYDEYEL